MRIKRDKDKDGNIAGYMMWLSADDTEQWARRPGAMWPCSTMSGHRCVVAVDNNGLYECTVDGKDSDKFPDFGSGGELEACVGDHLPKDCRHLWPTWE